MNRVENSAYFPVTDVQGNIRGYANTSGVQSAYAYYPYGALIDLAHNDAEDSRRWQAKEFDSDINKYYFGARFYDPLFGLWLTPDPAGQFANPYTYGGDPLNYIDPNGESLTAAIAIGAAVGAAIGASVSAVNCSGASEVSCGRAVAGGTIVGALAGAAGGGVGSAVSGAVGGVGGAIAGGASGGATSGTINYLGNSVTGNGSVDGMGLWTAFWQGAIGGAVSGGVGAYLGSGGYNINLLGNRGAEVLSSGLTNGLLSTYNGNGFAEGFLQGVAVGGFSSLLTSLFYSIASGTMTDMKFDGSDLSKAKLKLGDVIGWASDGSTLSDGIAFFTGEDITHVAIIDADEKGNLVLREANNEGEDIITPLSKIKGSHPYTNRNYKVFGNRNIEMTYLGYGTDDPGNRNGLGILGANYGLKPDVVGAYGYNGWGTNCTSQVTRWANSPYINNPGVLYRNMSGIVPFYISSTQVLTRGRSLW